MDKIWGLCGKTMLHIMFLQRAVLPVWFVASSLLVVVMTTATATATAAPAVSNANCPALWQRDVARLQDEKPQNLCQYAGKVVVVVNTASFCGFTSQYKGLEDLHKRYAQRGLVVLGFPSNDFGAQEPGSHKDIAAFCENTFGVKFPMFTKTRVSAQAAGALSPLYADLKQRTGESPKWNFHKYVVARDGQTVLSFPSEVEPTSAAFVKRLEQLLEVK
jgi:glutathione peroxidase